MATKIIEVEIPVIDGIEIDEKLVATYAVEHALIQAREKRLAELEATDTKLVSIESAKTVTAEPIKEVIEEK